MNSKDKKPTLEHLFQSKRFDLPDDRFWVDFQDQIKGRALASLSDSKRSKKILFGTAFFFPLALLAFLFHSTIKPIPTLETEASEVTSIHMQGLPFSSSVALPDSKNLGVIQDLENATYELENETSTLAAYAVDDASSFVEEKLLMDEHSLFEVGFLSNLEHNQDHVSVRYAF